MLSVKAQTISGFNEYIESLKNDKTSKNAKFTLTKFNGAKVEIVHDGVDIEKVIPLTDATYLPDCLTPLYDAIGKTIQSIKSDGPVLIVIQTDGQENDSKEFTQRGIFDLIAEKKRKGWTFVFLGADMDAYAVSDSMGISKGNTANYAGSQIGAVMRAVTTASINYTHSNSAQTENFFRDVNINTLKGKK
jgi:hypothetical protein